MRGELWAAPHLSLGVQLAQCRRVAFALGQPPRALPAHVPARDQQRGVSWQPRQVERPADGPAQTDRPGWLGATCVCSSSGRGRLHSVHAAVLRGRRPPYVCWVAAVWCAVAAVGRIALTAWWRAVHDEDTSRCSPMMRRPCGTLSSRWHYHGRVGKSWSSSTRLLADMSPGSPATAVCAAPAVQQSTHGSPTWWHRSGSLCRPSRAPTRFFEAQAGRAAQLVALAHSSRGTI